MKKFQLFPKKYGVFPYVFLFYLVLPLSYVNNETGYKAVIGYGLILLFLVSYRQLYCSASQKQFSGWLAIQITLVVIFTIGFDPYLSFMGFFPANFIGWYTNKKHFYTSLISFALALVLSFILLISQNVVTNVVYMLPFLVVMIAAPYGIRSMNQRMELEQQLNEANEQIKVLIKRDERVRIARDLHDTLGHTLSLITLQSQLVQRLADKQPDRVKDEAKEIEKTSRSALRHVRELVSDMRAITVEEEIASMEQLLKAASIAFHFERENDLPDLSLLQQNIFGMCIREAGTNIVKHSKAENCFVNFLNKRGDFTITVEDDGIGMPDFANYGNGLTGMRERLSIIEGKLDICTGRGTTLLMTVPIISKQKEGVVL